MAVEGWTLQTLKEHFEAMMAANDARYQQRFEASETAVAAALAAQKLATDTAIGTADKAVAKAESATERRFESVNEFRSTLSDQARLLMPRLESEALHRAVDLKIQNLMDKINALEKLRSEDIGAAQNKQTSSRQMNWLIGVVIAVIMAIVGYVMRRG